MLGVLLSALKLQLQCLSIRNLCTTFQRQNPRPPCCSCKDEVENVSSGCAHHITGACDGVHNLQVLKCDVSLRRGVTLRSNETVEWEDGKEPGRRHDPDCILSKAADSRGQPVSSCSWVMTSAEVPMEPVGRSSLLS